MSAFKTYLTGVQNLLDSEKATEHSYRALLADLIDGLEPELTVINEPKRSAVGAPDISVAKGHVPLGHVETKDVDVNLSNEAKKAQLKRYRAALTNLILTDYLEFRWYVDGKLKDTGRLAKKVNGKLKLDEKGVADVERILRAFLRQVTPTVGTPKELAEKMAAITREIHNLIVSTFEQEGEEGQLHNQLEAFQKTLIPELKPGDFADMYAQTIAYGLFAARAMTYNADEFSRWTAYKYLPRTNPFLRKMFWDIAGPDLDDRVAWLVDDLVDLLKHADMAAILENFGRRTRQEDPVVHFYETFLNKYDPRTKEKRGVYYTPEPVVSYIVRSVDEVLKDKFDRHLGFADPDTRILDPAAGTGTFLYHVMRLVHDRLQEQGMGGTWRGYVRQDLLPRVFGFELLMAPYTIAHMKLGILLQEYGYDFKNDERLRVYLTNTLEEGIHSREKISFAEFIAEEADAATEVKTEEPIEVVLGNPPWAGISDNKGDWITGLIQDYKQVDGEPLGERKHWLNDDYVKFIRAGQWRIEKTGRGVLAFVTNHGFLNNVTFRGMRQSLMQTFTDIYVLDLHGNSKKKEKAPDGGADRNVFDIQQGVAIGIFVKEPGKKGPARVHHAEMWGLREGKYQHLYATDVDNTEWAELEPASPYYFFDPRNPELFAEYQEGRKLTEIMPVNVSGIITARDHFVVDFNEQTLLDRIESLRSEVSDTDIRDEYFTGKGSSKYPPGDSRGWKLSEARRQVFADEEWANRTKRYLYRPFNDRLLYYVPWMVDWPRLDVMPQMLAKNLGLLTTRQTREGSWDALATDSMIGHKALAAYDINYLFPLYLYPQDDNLLDATEEGRRPNLSQEFLDDLSGRLKLRFVPDGKGDLSETFGPEDVFDYAYAIFHSPTYRQRYSEFLEIDFPRLPLTSDRALFSCLAEKGAEIVRLHLLRSPELNNPPVSFPVDGSSVVEKARYDEENKWVYINDEQYFEGIPKETWEFQVGGYRVLEKWLKDRKDRELSANDIFHYRKVVAALSGTRRLMREIDELIPEWPIR